VFLADFQSVPQRRARVYFSIKRTHTTQWPIKMHILNISYPPLSLVKKTRGAAQPHSLQETEKRNKPMAGYTSQFETTAHKPTYETT